MDQSYERKDAFDIQEVQRDGRELKRTFEATTPVKR
jgi:hypothetical protein